MTSTVHLQHPDLHRCYGPDQDNHLSPSCAFPCATCACSRVYAALGVYTVMSRKEVSVAVQCNMQAAAVNHDTRMAQ